MYKLDDRIYFLDAMRGILMMLGVFLHSAQVFNPEKTWAVFSEQSTVLSSYMLETIHLFRMPTFFIVSGYFCLLTIKKYGPTVFAKVRLQRILIPLIITALTLNSLQTYLLSSNGWLEFNLSIYLEKGRYISHLWFLVNLVIYFSCAYLIATYFSNATAKLNNTITTIFTNYPFLLVLFFMPLIWIGMKSTGKLGFPLYGDILGVIDIYKLLFYIPYFVFGLWLRENPQLLLRFTSLPIIKTIALLALSVYLYKAFDSPANLLGTVLHEYFHTLASWLSAAICFYIFAKYFNKKSKAFFFISEASYSVYLFHHIIVIGTGIILINMSIGYVSGLLTLITSTFIITFAIHHFIISKTPVLRYLFNGK